MALPMLVAAMLAAQTAPHPAPLAHRVSIPAGGGAVAADYRGRIDIATDQRGMAPPGRISTERCHWTATLSVERTLGGGDAHRAIGDVWDAKGSVPGDCRAVGALIDREVAARSGAAQQALVAAAEADRSLLLAEVAALPLGAADD